MRNGLQATFDFLGKTENRKAVEILVAGMDCSHKPSCTRSVQAILKRREPEGHAEVFRRLSKLDRKCHSYVRERTKRLVNVVSQTLEQGDHKEAVEACMAILKFRLYDVLPGLLVVAEKEDCVESDLAAKTILKLAEMFYGELSGVDEQPKRKDIENVRRQMTSTLEDAARRYLKHQRLEIVEAFLLVTKPSNATLRNLLRSPEEAAHAAVIEVLYNSQQGGVIRLLLGFLEDPQMPRRALRVMCERTDAKFVTNLLQRACPGQSRVKSYVETLRRFDDIAWAKPNYELLAGLDEDNQGNAVELLMASSLDQNHLLDVLEYMLAEGKPLGRRTAARALADFPGPRADSLVCKSLNDKDAVVRANILKQLRPRKIPGAMTLLIRMVDGASEPVREALSDALPEFSLHQFMMNFDSMPDEIQPLSGQLVRQIDINAAKHLQGELGSLSPVRRRRAVNVAEAMGLVCKLEEFIVPLMSDSDHMVRVAAAQALADCDTETSWETLRDALFDRSVVVQEAAEKSLLRISQSLQKVRDDEGNETEEPSVENQTTQLR
ncbi:MAG: HEAT repeat domain-containing protein [Pirellulales bacterium]|nr:HEAT repeat domain-containing protein [Pirellulales bacterium]